MMAARRVALIDRLPSVRGRLRADVPLGRLTWFCVGGAAEAMFTPADIDDLARFLARKPADVPVTVIGVCSNLLVRDGGVDGVVVRLGRGLAKIETSPQDGVVTTGAGALDINVARAACEAGIAGLEFLSGVPGTVGGALRMNAGAYGREMVDVVIRARALDASGNSRDLANDEIGFGYRHAGVPEDWIFTGAELRGHADGPRDIAARMAEIQAERQASQPIRTRTGGSTFANPPGAKAWELIDRAGCRGLRRGAAMVSEKHCNFLINTGDATAAELEGLGEEVRRRVLDETGVTLEWEIRRIGRHERPGPTGEAPS